jgi:hypothetical protein
MTHFWDIPPWAMPTAIESHAFSVMTPRNQHKLNLKRRKTMNTELTNRVTMIKTSSSYMAEQSAIWSTMAPLQAAMTELDAKIAEIDAAAQKHETPHGATADKAGARDALEDTTFLMCEALGVLAHESGDNDLVALTRVTRTLLDRMGAEELSNRATAVLAQANAHKTELATFQVTQANIDELNDALRNFNEAKTAPRTATAQRVALTESLPKLVNEATDILKNRIDRLVSLFSRTNPDFVAGYESARVIVDRAATHKAKAAAAPAPPTNP